MVSMVSCHYPSQERSKAPGLMSPASSRTIVLEQDTRAYGITNQLDFENFGLPSARKNLKYATKLEFETIAKCLVENIHKLLDCQFGILKQFLTSFVMLWNIGNAAFDELGSSTSRANQLINQLKTVGADADVELPRIAFAGKQSAGKSSLVEALTGIQLPRNHGTCTRCPIEVTTTRVSSDKPWKCTIELRFDYDDKTKEKLSKPLTKPFCQLGEQNRMDTAQRIKDAQDEILKEGGIKFTRNSICIYIESSDCHDISIIDLPGLIASQDLPEDEIYINLITDLVRDYIKGKNTIILQCLESAEDFENQMIRTLAREVDPEGKRTIGVLMKPDRIEVGKEKDIVEILANMRYALHYGYYMVKTPSPEELNLLGSDPAKFCTKRHMIEERFFKADPMGKFFNSSSPERCGSNWLVAKLSSMLKGMIDIQIPLIKEKLQTELDKTSAELNKLGNVIRKEQAREIVLDECRKFSLKAATAIDAAKTLEKTFWHSVVKVFNETKTKLEDCSPLFEVNGKLVGFNIGSCRGTIQLQIDRQTLQKGGVIKTDKKLIGGAFWSLELSSQSARLVCEKLPRGARCIRAKYVLNSNVAVTRVEFETDFYEKSGSGACSLNLARLSPAVRVDATIDVQYYTAEHGCKEVRSVSEVREKIVEATGRELPLPGRPQYEACESYIIDAVTSWEMPVIQCVKRTEGLLSELAVGSLEDALLNEIDPRFVLLREKAADIIDDFVHALGAVTLERAQELCSMEKHPFTSNEEGISNARASFITTINGLLDPQDSASNAHQQEIEVMAGALAYFKIKVTAFCDYLFMVIQRHLLHKFRGGCENELRSKLSLYDADDTKLQNLLEEDSGIGMRRLKFARDLDRQKEAMKLIHGYRNI